MNDMGFTLENSKSDIDFVFKSCTQEYNLHEYFKFVDGQKWKIAFYDYSNKDNIVIITMGQSCFNNLLEELEIYEETNNYIDGVKITTYSIEEGYYREFRENKTGGKDKNQLYLYSNSTLEKIKDVEHKNQLEKEARLKEQRIKEEEEKIARDEEAKRIAEERKIAAQNKLEEEAKRLEEEQKIAKKEIETPTENAAPSQYNYSYSSGFSSFFENISDEFADLYITTYITWPYICRTFYRYPAGNSLDTPICPTIGSSFVAEDGDWGIWC